MTFIYDILLNFQTSFIDFYDWNDNDNIVNIESIPIFKVSSNFIKDFIYNDVIVSKDFLTFIKDKCICYKCKNYYDYTCLFCDCRKVVAIAFDSSGKNVYKSDLLIDEYYDVLNLIDSFSDIDIKYNLVKENNYNYFFTRLEKSINVYLNDIYEDKLCNKFNYLLCEYNLDISKSSKDDVINILCKYFSNNYNEFEKVKNFLNN